MFLTPFIHLSLIGLFFLELTEIKYPLSTEKLPFQMGNILIGKYNNFSVNASNFDHPPQDITKKEKKPSLRLIDILKRIFSFLDNPENELEVLSPDYKCDLEVTEDENIEKSPPPPPPVNQALFSKDIKEIDEYFSCYQKDTKYTDRYKNKLRSNIEKAVENYMEVTSKDSKITSQEVQSLVSCLIFRESAGWKNPTSPTGAKGIGQFTSTAIAHIKRMLSSEIEEDSYIDSEIKKFEELYNREKSQKKKDVYNESIIYLNNKKRVNARKRVMQDYWNNIKANKPAISSIDSNYIFNLDNSEITVHLIMLLMIDCQESYKQADLECFAGAADKMLFSCTGAYNMGVGGFYRNALKDCVGDDCFINDWVSNLEKSNDNQREETRKHLISIYRCAKKGSNFPMCGTDYDYCEDELPNANICKYDKEIIPCHGQECP